ncbi:MAG: ECF transporter S component [Kurthia sp.]|nr:ECF transporter S component [Candidatus Kurthia equi]
MTLKHPTHTSTRSKTLDLTIIAMLATLVFVATLILNIKLPLPGNGGLVHLGTAMLFISSILFGPKKGAYAGAIGLGLFDLVGGWVLWAPITIIARALQGYIVGKIAWSNEKNGTSFLYNLLALVVSIPVMMSIYYIGESILYGNWITPLTSLPGDFMQNILGVFLALPVCKILQKMPTIKKYLLRNS